MPKYRKKPVVIEAVQYDGSFPLDFLDDAESVAMAGDGTTDIIIRTLEGDMRANVGDWIIRGVKDEMYPCKPDIFEATYEAVANDQNAGSDSGLTEADRQRDTYLPAAKGGPRGNN